MTEPVPFTADQQKAMAIARARRRRAEAAPRLAHPEFDGSNVPGYNPETGLVERYGMPGSAAMGAADVVTMGFGDELSAVPATLIDQLPGGQGRGYSDVLSEIRGNQGDAYADNPVSYVSGQVGGGLAGGYGLARSGLSLAAKAAERGSGLLRIALGGAADGAGLGMVHGAGSGEGVEDRAAKAITGGSLGFGLGFAAPYLVAGAVNAARPFVAPIMARLRPEAYAERALGEGLKRAGTTPGDVEAALLAAQNDGQGVYMVADAMGHSGQRLLSTAARNPHEGRQALVEALEARQAGQGRRITTALSEGFGATDTASQRSAALTSQRNTEAAARYGEARRAAMPVNVSGTVKAIDDVLLPGVHQLARPNNGIANDSIEGALSRVKGMLTDGRSNLTDFNAVFRAKLDIDDMVSRATAQGAGNRAHYLSNVQRTLDDALAEASPPYAAARDAFAAASRRIDAVETGRAAAMRGRTEDTTRVFAAMTPEEQAAFRAGYVDPLIAQTQGAAVGVDKARPLISDATGIEFGRFAEPGKASQLWNRLGREKRMFETRRQATGGSQTADNLADSSDMANFDPSIMVNLMRGSYGQAIAAALTRGLNEVKGLPPTVLERVTKALLETDPAAAKNLLTSSGGRAATAADRQALANAILTNSGASGVGRLPSR